MKILQSIILLSGCILFITGICRGQNGWPGSLYTSDGSEIKVYEPAPETFQGNILKERAAFSLTRKGGAEPVFGTLWAIMAVETDRDNRMVHILSVRIPNLRLDGDSDMSRLNSLKVQLEAGLLHMNIDLPLDVLLASLDMNTEERNLSQGLNNSPPRIVYQSRPSMLVLIDGQPIVQYKNDWGMEAVVNTPNTIIKYTDGHFYLYGGRHWYLSSGAAGPYAYTGVVPSELERIQDEIDAANEANAEYTDSAAAADTAISNVIVSTEPAELIQTNGDPVFTVIPGTGLSYVYNSNNDIFMDSESRQYYILISGRWYETGNLQGNWHYIPSDGLPSGFAKIPEGSPKDNVLASVAGTHAAREALLDAQIPQTAKVDRRNARADVVYDGAPQFLEIPGTHMQYAVNTPNSVISSGGMYYCVDKGVWFEADNAAGPWQICTRRPDEVGLIPPSCPVYNLKYVYIYEADPDWVYEGYTPGYLNTYIYGPTVVFGTGFYYLPWRARFFYPRPWTWGFNMWYNPWLGWTFGLDYGLDWFNWGIGPGWGFWYGGWWGPWIFRPPYIGSGYFHDGFYGRNSFIARNRFFNYNNNIYRSRQDVYNREAQSHLFTDGRGNIFRRDGQNGWQQRDGRTWKPVDNGRQNQTIQGLERQEQMHDRGLMRTQNFQMSRGGIFGGSRSGGGVFRGGGRR